MVARVYALNGNYAGRVVYVVKYLPNDYVECVLRDMGGESSHIVPMERILITND